MDFPVIINQAGPLPISTDVKWPSSETVVVAVSGTAYAQAPGTMLRVRLYVRNTWIGSIQLMANQAVQHVPLPTNFITTTGVFGEFAVSLVAEPGTVTDQNDRFTVALLY